MTTRTEKRKLKTIRDTLLTVHAGYDFSSEDVKEAIALVDELIQPAKKTAQKKRTSPPKKEVVLFSLEWWLG